MSTRQLLKKILFLIFVFSTNIIGHAEDFIPAYIQKFQKYDASFKHAGISDEVKLRKKSLQNERFFYEAVAMSFMALDYERHFSESYFDFLSTHAAEYISIVPKKQNTACKAAFALACFFQKRYDDADNILTELSLDKKLPGAQLLQSYIAFIENKKEKFKLFLSPLKMNPFITINLASYLIMATEIKHTNFPRNFYLMLADCNDWSSYKYIEHEILTLTAYLFFRKVFKKNINLNLSEFNQSISDSAGDPLISAMRKCKFNVFYGLTIVDTSSGVCMVGTLIYTCNPKLKGNFYVLYSPVSGLVTENSGAIGYQMFIPYSDSLK